jgi:hypothetical protein
MRYADFLSHGALAHAARCPIHRAGVSRRQFLQSTAGLTAFAATLGSSIPRADAAPGIGLVTPIPATLTFFGKEFHVQAPPLTGADSDPSSVYNFKGNAGIAFISGTVERRDRKSGESRVLPFAFNDMRFMQGEFKGRDGHVRSGTFVFTWIDVYDPGLGDPPPQVHDFNPGITQNGVFWTSVGEEENVHVDLSNGRAIMEVRDLHMKDYTDFHNAVVGGGPPPVPGIVSYRVEWNAVGAVNSFDNAAQKFRGEFRDAIARMEWTARTPDYDFVSAPIGTSTTDAAELGSERNGSFY